MSKGYGFAGKCIFLNIIGRFTKVSLLQQQLPISLLGANPRYFYYGRSTKSALKSLYNRKSPPGTLNYEKLSFKELFTMDSEIIPLVKACSKG